MPLGRLQRSKNVARNRDAALASYCIDKKSCNDAVLLLNVFLEYNLLLKNYEKPIVNR